MRKFIAVLLSVTAVTMTLAGCGSGSTGTGNEVSGNGSVGSVSSLGVSGSSSVSNNSGGKSSSGTTDTSGVEADYASLKASEGLDIVSNGDGTCNIVGIGICKDKDIVIPTQSSSGDKVTMIAERAFADAKNLDTLYFLGNNIEIDDKAFQSSKVKKIIISGSELSTGENVFAYCDNINEIHIGNSKVSVGEYAFYDAGDDISVTLNSSEIELDKKAFQNSDIKSLQINDCNIEAGQNSFAYCDDIAEINVTGGTVSIDDYSFYDSGKNMIVTFGDCELTIDDKGFQACGIKTLTIENCKTSIGENAFAYCEDLETLTIGKGSTEIESYAFYDCTSMTTVSIGGSQDSDDNVIIIDDKAFQACGVESVSIAGKSVEIGKSAFAYSEGLSSVTIGNGSLKVKDYAFYDCSKDLVITYAGNTYTADSILKVK